MAKKAKKKAVKPPAKQEPRVVCPECGAGILLPADAEEGRLVECLECGCSLEVVRKGTKRAVQTLERAEERYEIERPEEEEFE